MVTFKIVQEGSLLKQLAENATNTKPILKRWTGLMKSRAKEIIESGAGLAPLAASTQKKYAQTGSTSVTSAGKVRASYGRRLDAALKRKGDEEGRSDLRILLGGVLNRKSQSKAVASLQKRLQRADAARASGAKLAIGKRKSEKQKNILGKLIGAFKGGIEGATAFVENAVAWSQAHNAGATVGNGAVLPKREFFRMDQATASEMADIALDELMPRGR